MPYDERHVTDAELSVLEFLWQSGPVAKKHIVQGLYPSETESDRATVQKLLERLEAKGYVTRDRGRHAHVFAAGLTRTEFAGEQLEAVARKVSGGSLFPLVLHLVEGKGLSVRERAQLREILKQKKR